MSSCLWCKNENAKEREHNDETRVFCNKKCQEMFYVQGKNDRDEPDPMKTLLERLGALDTSHFLYINETDTYDTEKWKDAVFNWTSGVDVISFKSPGGLTNPSEEQLENHTQYLKNYAEDLLKRAGERVDRFSLKAANQRVILTVATKRARRQRVPHKLAAFTEDDYIQYVYDLIYHGDALPPFFSDDIVQSARVRYQEMVEKFLVYANKGNVEHIESMLNNGFDPNARGKQGWTALALAMNHPSVVKALLALPRTERNARLPDGKTALEVYALYALRLECFTLLYRDPYTDTSTIEAFIRDKVPPSRGNDLLKLL